MRLTWVSHVQSNRSDRVQTSGTTNTLQRPEGEIQPLFIRSPTVVVTSPPPPSIFLCARYPKKKGPQLDQSRAFCEARPRGAACLDTDPREKPLLARLVTPHCPEAFSGSFGLSPRGLPGPACLSPCNSTALLPSAEGCCLSAVPPGLYRTNASVSGGRAPPLLFVFLLSRSSTSWPAFPLYRGRAFPVQQLRNLFSGLPCFAAPASGCKQRPAPKTLAHCSQRPFRGLGRPSLRVCTPGQSRRPGHPPTPRSRGLHVCQWRVRPPGKNKRWRNSGAYN